MAHSHMCCNARSRECAVFIFSICPVSWEMQHSEMVYSGVWPMNVKPGEITAQGRPMTELKKKAPAHTNTHTLRRQSSRRIKPI